MGQSSTARTTTRDDARARCDGEDINRRATATTRARARGCETRSSEGRRRRRDAAATKETLVLDDAAREAREATVGAASEEESRHLRRHVDALTRDVRGRRRQGERGRDREGDDSNNCGAKTRR